eukprot:6182579-Pleurochrysis_carterae.AAC.1
MMVLCSTQEWHQLRLSSRRCALKTVELLLEPDHTNQFCTITKGAWPMAAPIWAMILSHHFSVLFGAHEYSIVLEQAFADH